MIKVTLCAFSDEADASLEGQIEALKRNNVPYMEMRNVNGKNVTELTLEEAKEVRATLDANGIQVWSIGSPIGKVDIDTDFAPGGSTIVGVRTLEEHGFRGAVMDCVEQAYQKSRVLGKK